MAIVLIYGHDRDQHINAISKELLNLGVAPLLLERYKTGHYLTHTITMSGHKTILNIDNKKYDVEKDILSFYWRPKPQTDSEKYWVSCSREDIYKSSEWYISSNAINFLNNNLFTVNNIDSEIRLDNKAYQLMLASKCGLIIPNTTITNDYEETIKLKTKLLVRKNLSCMFEENGKQIFTEKFNTEDPILEKNAAVMPRIYQPLIEKSHELRVYMVNNNIFVIKIDSQLDKDGCIDWRTASNMDFFSVDELSQETHEKLIQFQQKAKLTYGAYDFIVDKEGREIFLECNPSGNWLFVGIDVANEISKTIAHTLVNPNLTQLLI